MKIVEKFFEGLQTEVQTVSHAGLGFGANLKSLSYQMLAQANGTMGTAMFTNIRLHSSSRLHS